MRGCGPCSKQVMPLLFGSWCCFSLTLAPRITLNMDTGGDEILTLELLNQVLPASKVIKEEVMKVLEETSLRIWNAMEMSTWMSETPFISPCFPERHKHNVE